LRGRTRPGSRDMLYVWAGVWAVVALVCFALGRPWFGLSAALMTGYSLVLRRWPAIPRWTWLVVLVLLGLFVAPLQWVLAATPSPAGPSPVSPAAALATDLPAAPAGFVTDGAPAGARTCVADALAPPVVGARQRYASITSPTELSVCLEQMANGSDASLQADSAVAGLTPVGDPAVAGQPASRVHTDPTRPGRLVAEVVKGDHLAEVTATARTGAPTPADRAAVGTLAEQAYASLPGGG
ncbi:MAG TPA: hypothetical protein VKG43_08280, partial [Acidimicrobiales bacterium]|nr:hypothetical protein [Acidimicrobiales bacterium]